MDVDQKESSSQDESLSRQRRQVLTIAGSDPGGGAGIQGDIKSIEANGGYALSVVTSITAQNSIAVMDAFDLPRHIISSQMKAVFEDFHPSAIKTGMLSSKEIVITIASLLRFFAKSRPTINLVVDPVMISKSGYALLRADAVDALKSELIPLATLVTPNIPEAESLTGLTIKNRSDVEKAARKILGFGCQAVLIKGGHYEALPGCDFLFDGQEEHVFKGEFIETSHTHGTGCTYSAAIATQLAMEKSLCEAVQIAKRHITEAIRHGHAIGQGQGPTNPFYFLEHGE